jgi:exosome complex component RRP4
MAITILPPTQSAPVYREDVSDQSDSDNDDGGVDLTGDTNMRPAKRARHTSDIVTPGETVTDDPQWMRYAQK